MIFQKELQARCHEGVTLASVLCGLMSDLLTLDFSGIKNYQIFGVEIDESAIARAQEKALGLKVTLLKGDAWSFTCQSPSMC